MEKLIEPKFKDGDVIYLLSGTGFGSISIFKNENKKSIYTHVDLDSGNYLHIPNYDGWCWDYKTKIQRLATEEEKEKLFKAIKDNGYKWNEETKTLEKLSKFKIGDRVRNVKNNSSSGIIAEIYDNGSFKVDLQGYGVSYNRLDKQDEWELVPDKFDISTLKPFDKVLVRGNVGQKWVIDFFGFMDKNKGLPFVCVGQYVIQCIPYENNEHLCGTTNDCDEYYKTWK